MPAERSYWPLGFKKEFISIYRKSECLWNVKSSVYKNKSLKKKALEKLRQKCLEIDENATIELVNKKIYRIRRNFLHAINIQLKTKESGEKLKSKLDVYDDMKFLLDQFIEKSLTKSKLISDLPEDEYLKSFFESPEDFDLFENFDFEGFDFGPELDETTIEHIAGCSNDCNFEECNSNKTKNILNTYQGDTIFNNILQYLNDRENEFHNNLIEDGKSNGQTAQITSNTDLELMDIIDEPIQDSRISKDDLQQSKKRFRKDSNVILTEGNSENITELLNINDSNIDPLSEIGNSSGEKFKKVAPKATGDNSLKRSRKKTKTNLIENNNEKIISSQKSHKRTNKRKINRKKQSKHVVENTDIEGDECDLYTKYMACEMKTLSMDDLTFLKKILNDTLFEAKLGNAKYIRLVTKAELQLNKNRQ